MTQPSGYRGPHDPARDRDQVMLDPVAQNLIVDIVDCHNALCVELDKDVERAAHPPDGTEAGAITGTGDHDQMDVRAAEVRAAEAERARRLKNARQELRRVIDYYQRGQRPPRARLESIDYLDGAKRRVG